MVSRYVQVSVCSKCLGPKVKGEECPRCLIAAMNIGGPRCPGCGASRSSIRQWRYDCGSIIEPDNLRRPKVSHECLKRQVAERTQERNRARAQITEAIAILEGGTDYEKIHVTSILKDGL